MPSLASVLVIISFFVHSTLNFSWAVPTNNKPILQSRLEGEAEKDAMQKSDAAREAFLAELAKDKKSSGSKELENVKQARGKAKEKRKPKDQKKSKDVKVSGELVSYICLKWAC